jgi:hypothetical protein
MSCKTKLWQLIHDVQKSGIVYTYLRKTEEYYTDWKNTSETGLMSRIYKVLKNTKAKEQMANFKMGSRSK